MEGETVVTSLRELDALMAEHVMDYRWATFLGTAYLIPARNFDHFVRPGLSWQEGRHGDPDLDWMRLPNHSNLTVPPFSTSIAAAWEVVERMREEDGREFVTLTVRHDKQWAAYFSNQSGQRTSGASGYATAPLAICLAALRARGITVDLRLEGEDGT